MTSSRDVPRGEAYDPREKSGTTYKSLRKSIICTSYKILFNITFKFKYIFIDIPLFVQKIFCAPLSKKNFRVRV